MIILTAGSSVTLNLAAYNGFTVTGRNRATVLVDGVTTTVDGTTVFGLYSSAKTAVITAANGDCEYDLTFPASGEAGKVYADPVSGSVYRWDSATGAYVGVGVPKTAKIGSPYSDAYGTTVASGVVSLVPLINTIYDPHAWGNTLVTKSCIRVPSGASFINVKAHVSFTTSGGTAGICRGHLWRNVGATPSYTAAGVALAAKLGLTLAQTFQANGAGNPMHTPEAHYHCASVLPVSVGSSYVSLPLITGRIPVYAENEEWTVYCHHNTVGTAYIGGSTSGPENWLEVEVVE